MREFYQRVRNAGEHEFGEVMAELARVPQQKALEIAESLSQDSNEICRSRSIELMLGLDPPQGELLACRLLNDSNWLVRVTALDVLSRSRCQAAVPKVQSMLTEDEDEVVRSWAAFCLGVAGGDDSIPVLERSMEFDTGVNHEGVPISEIAAQAIGKIQSRRLGQ